MRLTTPVICGILGLGGVFAQTAPVGKTEFQARCSGCHGDDGSGGGHGPNIIDVRQPRATTREALRELIRKGIPEAGMPAFPLPDAVLDSITTYFLSLKTPAATTGATAAGGDVAAGERFFRVEGKCAGCHMVRSRGGILGPDLSNVGRERTPEQLEQVIRNPGTLPPRGAGGGRGGRGGAAAPAFRAVNVRLKNGQTVRGVPKNESTFDLQVLSTAGKLHLIQKDQVADVARERTVMPKVDATPEQMRNLLAYLRGLTSSGSGNVLATGEAGPGVPFADVAQPKPGTWPTYHGNMSGNRFSPLSQINTGNVDRLAPKWMFTLPGAGAGRALQVTPVVVDGVMYVTAVNEAWALDARSGREIWHYSRPRTQGLAGDAASGINRGVAVLGDRVFMVTDHAHLIALHRLTGQLLWDVEMADYRQNYGATGAPLVVNDLVISGISGGDEGVRGFLDAYKVATGERAWRFWTVPMPGEPGSETWVGRAAEHGCAATWLTGAYDPEAKLLYWPTGNPCPDYNGAERKGDNLFSASVIALDPATGKLKWHFQFTPHDLHDWDATETPMLVDAAWRGQQRKLLLHGDRNGFFYVLDRLTGKFLMAEPFVKNITWASGIDANGRPKLLPGNEPTVEGQRTCPAVAGATNWPSTAFSPATGLFYLFAQESCNIYSKNDTWWEAGKSFYGGGTRRAPGEEAGGKFLRALDIQTGKIAWEIADIGGGILGSGLMATAGGLIFYGDGNGAFVAVDSKNGKLLWHFNTGQGWKAGPMTYTIDGNQYVGVLAGSTVLAFSLR